MGFTHRVSLLPSWFPRLWRIDYVWHNDAFAAIRARVGDDNGTSDHFPLIVSLVLKTK
jgi:endonuclease/exonuclease/phosphatase family metal-dependent hydrolase